MWRKKPRLVKMAEVLVCVCVHDVCLYGVCVCLYMVSVWCVCARVTVRVTYLIRR